MTRLCLITTFALTSMTSAWAAKPRCTSDVPVRWEIRPVYIDGVTTNAIQSDGSTYTTGGPGILETDVRLCDGTGDAVLFLNTIGPSRTISVSFAKMLASTSQTPSWALAGNTITHAGWALNVRNAWYLPTGMTRSDEYEFTTHLKGHGPLNVHNFMVNPVVQAVPADATAGTNSPYPDSLVRVHHCPADTTPPTSGQCAGISKETWLVWPDPESYASGSLGLPITQVASLLSDGKGNNQSNAGEFSIAFYFVITSLQ